MGWSVLLESNGKGLGMLLNTLQCTGQPSTTKNGLVQNISSADVEKSWPNSMTIKREDMGVLREMQVVSEWPT